MYIVMGIILVAVGSLVWLTLAMRKAEHSKWLLRAVALLRVVYDIIFVILSVSPYAVPVRASSLPCPRTCMCCHTERWYGVQLST